MANTNNQIPEDDGLESDDDVSKAAKDMGLYEDADEEHPKEVGIAQEVEKDEKLRQEGN